MSLGINIRPNSALIVVRGARAQTRAHALFFAGWVLESRDVFRSGHSARPRRSVWKGSRAAAHRLMSSQSIYRRRIDLLMEFKERFSRGNNTGLRGGNIAAETDGCFVSRPLSFGFKPRLITTTLFLITLFDLLYTTSSAAW